MTFLGDLPRAGRLLLAAVAVDSLGIGLALPFAVVYLHEIRHIDLATVGLLLSIPPAVALVGVGPAGTLIDSLGSRRVQIGAIAFSCLGMAALSQAHEVWSAALALALTGMGQAAFFPANLALISSTIPADQRQRYFGLNFTVLNAGIGVGGVASGLFVNVGRPWTFEVIYLADSASFLVPLGLLLLVLRDIGGPSTAPAVDDHPPSYRIVLRDSAFRRLFAVTFVSAFVGYAQLEAGWTAFARVVGHLPTRGIGLAFAANTAVIVLLQLPMLRLIAGRRRTRMLMVMALIWLVSWAVIGVGGWLGGGLLGFTLLVASAGIFGLGETLQSPVVPALVNDLSTDQLRGRYNAANSFAFQVAAVVGPATAGLLIGNGWDTAYIVLLMAGCLTIIGLLWRLERRIPLSVNGIAHG